MIAATTYNYDLLMATAYLETILRAHRERVAADQRDWRRRVEEVRYDGPSFFDALASRSNPHVKVIAEIKRRSPSKGWIDEHLDPAQLAADYERGGASAISVLTDEQFFAGSPHDVAVVRASSSLPVLRKDFTLCENDVLDAAEMGAGAVLLIVAALSDEQLANLLELATTVNVAALVEVHDEKEAERAARRGARIVGVNQRDLRTFSVDEERAAKVGRALGDVLTVAESGLLSPRDVARAGEAGFDAVLVGEAFVRAADPEATVRSFSQIPRQRHD